MKTKLKDFYKLTRLYFGFLFQKVTIIILLISFISMILLLILICNSSYEYIDYLKDYLSIHEKYINQALLIITLFNSIIISSMVISLYINSISFDKLFISRIKRRTLCISKITLLFIVISFICFIETIIIYMIPLIRYPFFKIGENLFIIPFYLILPLLVEAIVMITLTVLVPNVFVTLAFTFASIALKLVLMNVEKINDFISYIIPYSYNNGIMIYSHALYMVLVWGLLFFILYIKIYEVKDLK